MINNVLSWINDVVSRSFKTSIILVYNAAIVTISAVIYPALPFFMGYPPEIIEASRNINETISYDLQYIIVAIFCIVIGTICLLFIIKGFNKVDFHSDMIDISPLELNELRKKCINLPYLIYIFQLVLLLTPVFILLIILVFINRTPIINVIRTFSLIFSMVSLISVISQLFMKRIFTSVLLKLNAEDKIGGMRISLRTKIFLQLTPMFIISVLLTGLMGYSRVMEEKGDLVYYICRDTLYSNINLENATNVEQIFNSFQKPNIENVDFSYFVVKDGQYISSDGYKPAVYFKYFLKNPVGIDHDRVYSETTEVQAVMRAIKGSMGDLQVGIRYELSSPKTRTFFLVTFFSILILFIIILYYVVTSLTREISLVSQSLNKISDGNDITSYRKIPVTSNDEISDLVNAFNKLRVKQYEYDKLKTEFMVNVSHELRTPINLLFASIQLLELYIKSGMYNNLEKFLKGFNSMKQNCLRLLRLINNIIDISKIDAGYIELNLQTIDIIQHIEKITMSAIELIKRKSITLQFDTDTEELMMKCDLDKIETIILNLLSNAIKFTKEKGSIFVNLFCKDNTLIISIKDTGIGIPEDKLGMIFERFRQVNQSLVRSHEGSGIGLSLVKSLVELHGGSIRAISKEGIGSEFIVELPILAVPGDKEVRNSQDDISVNSSGVNKVNIEFSDIYYTD